MKKIHLTRSVAYAMTIYVGLLLPSICMESSRPDFREGQERSHMERILPPEMVNWKKIDISNLSQDDKSYLNNRMYHRIELINPTTSAIGDLSRMIPDTLFGLDLSGSTTLIDTRRFRPFTNLEYFLSPRNFNIPLGDYVILLESLKNIRFLTIYGSIEESRVFAINDFEMVAKSLPDSIEKIQIVLTGDPDVINKGFDIIKNQLKEKVEKINHSYRRGEHKKEIEFIGKIVNPENAK